MWSEATLTLLGEEAASARSRVNRYVQAALTWARGHTRALAYVLPPALALAAVQTWFDPGTVIAGGDLGPPFAPGGEYIAHWNHLWNGSGGPSYSISQFPYFMLLTAGQAMGVSAEVVQRVWLSTIFAGSAAAGVFLTLSVTRSSIAGGVGGLLLAFNAYRVLLGPDPIAMAAFVLAGLLGGIVVRAAVSKGSVARHVAAFALTSMGLSFVSANPPHILLLLVWVVACTAIAWAVGGRRAFGSAWVFLAKAAPFVLLVNLWWVVPALLTISSAPFHEQFAATSPRSWAWTHRRASLLNGISLNTAWGWEEAAYFPYSSSLDRPPVAQLRFFLPGLALIGLVAARKRTRLVAASFAVIALLGVLIAKGYHPPLVGLNAWLYEHAPGYWLLRDPMKALLLTTLAFCVLGGIAVDRLLRLRPTLRPAGVVLSLALVGGTIAYAFPMYTGEVIPDRRPLLPSAHVQVPRQWLEAVSFINAQPSGRVLVLPAADYYQLRTTWGYYGAPFMAHAIHHPVIELAPGGYLDATASVSDLVGAIQERVVAGDGYEAGRLLHALGVRYVVLRRDLGAGGSSRPNAPTPELSRHLTRGMMRVPNLEPLRSFEPLVVYELAAGERSDVYPALPVPFSGSSMEVASALDVTRSARSLIEDPSRLDSLPSLDEVASPGGRVRPFLSDAERLWEAWIIRRADGHTLRLVDPLRITIDGTEVQRLKPIEMDLGAGSPSLLEMGGVRYVVDEGMDGPVRLGLLRLPAEAEIRVLQRHDTRVIHPSTAGPVGDCNRYDDRTPGQLGLSRSVLSVDGVPTLQLSARDHAACVSFPIVPFDKDARYRVSFEYRKLEGADPRACLWEEGAERCDPFRVRSSSSGWHRVERVMTAHPKTTALRLFFYADGTGEGTTTAQYRRVVISRYDVAATRSLDPSSGLLGQLTLPEGLLPVEIESPLSQPNGIVLATAGPVGDCNRYDDRTPGQVGLSRSILSVDGVPTLRLTARDHAACVSFPIVPFEKAALYRMSFEYKTVDGAAPRACVFQGGSGKCAELPALDPSRGWHRMDEVITIDPKTHDLQLFFYADGTGEGATTTEYRDVRVSAVPPANLVLLGIPLPSFDLPNVTFARVGPAEVRAQVSGAKGPTLLVLTESFAPGWRIEVPGRDDSGVRHVRVDGYANGWLIPWDGTYEVRFMYAPDAIARVARWTGLVFVPLLLLWFIRAGRRSRKSDGGRWTLRSRTPRVTADA